MKQPTPVPQHFTIRHLKKWAWKDYVTVALRHIRLSVSITNRSRSPLSMRTAPPLISSTSFSALLHPLGRHRLPQPEANLLQVLPAPAYECPRRNGAIGSSRRDKGGPGDGHSGCSCTPHQRGAGLTARPVAFIDLPRICSETRSAGFFLAVSNRRIPRSTPFYIIVKRVQSTQGR